MSKPIAKYVAAIDQGTSSTRVLVLNHDSEPVAMVRTEHANLFPSPGWVESNPLEIWNNVLELMPKALAQARIQAADLLAIGITNQRETVLLWDKQTGEPVYNAIGWQDARVADWVTEFEQNIGSHWFHQKTGLPLTSYFSALKIRWILAQLRKQGVAHQGRLLAGTMDSWLIWKMTGGPNGGVHVTDVTNASRTQLLNIATLQWDPELCSAFGIDMELLPKIVSSSEHVATCQAGAFAGVPITGVLGDQQAALVGQTCFEPGQAKNTYGTGCFLLANTGTQPVFSQSGLLTTVAYQFGKQAPVYALEGSVAVAGALINWLKDSLGLISSSEEVESLAASVQDNGGVYIVPAFSGLYAPYWDTRARGLIAGLTAYAGRPHIARAALEAVAYQTRDILELMQRESGVAMTELRVDGGMTANNTLMQFQADILNTRVVKPKNQETTVLGAAFAAGLAVGYWQKSEELVSTWKLHHAWTASMPHEQREQLYGRWKKSVSRACDWL